MGRVIWGLTALACGALAALPARAGTFLDDLQSSKGYTLTLGAEGRMTPRYEGSSKYEFMPLPLFDLRPLGTAPRFHSPRDSLGFSLFELGPFDFGPVGYLEFARKRKKNAGLAGLDDVKTAYEFGGYGEYWAFPWLRARVEVRKGFHGHHGVVADEMLDAVVPVGNGFTLSGGPRMRIADESANSRYFDISPAESLTSGLPVYDTSAGVRSVGGGGQVLYRWSPQWEVHSFVEYDRLVGGPANSPIVTVRGSPNQFTLGTGFGYSFDVPN